MPAEPAVKRAFAFIDGQNLFFAAKYAFGYQWPNYDPVALAAAVCNAQGWSLAKVHFYTGVPSAQDKPLPNLRLKLLEKLLSDEISARAKKNIARARSFRELLEKTLQKYHNRLIDAAAVIKAMIEIRQEMEDSDRRAAELGLTEEELAFYDAVAASFDQVYDDTFLRDLIHEIVQTIRRNLKVDWTEPHRADVKAGVRAAVKRVLRAKGVKPGDFDQFVGFIMSQAEALYAQWPVAA